jgi:hypothetical protein
LAVQCFAPAVGAFDLLAARRERRFRREEIIYNASGLDDFAITSFRYSQQIENMVVAELVIGDFLSSCPSKAAPLRRRPSWGRDDGPEPAQRLVLATAQAAKFDRAIGTAARYGPPGRLPALANAIPAYVQPVRRLQAVSVVISILPNLLREVATISAAVLYSVMDGPIRSIWV